MANALLHPDMLTQLADFFPHAGTIQAATNSNVAGTVSQSWANVVGHVSLPCVVAPVVKSGGDEVRRDQLIVTTATHKVRIRGHYPSIATGNRIVVVTTNRSLTLNILGVKHDSQETQTLLDCELVSA